MASKITNAGKHLIMAFEDVKPKAYLCPAGYWTIGVGHKIRGNDVNLEMVLGKEAAYNILHETLDEQEILALLALDLQDYIKPIISKVGTRLKPNELDALISLVFNIGATEFKKSTLLKKILSNASKENIAHEMLRWCYVDKKISKGLLKRRYVEAAVFLGSFPKATKVKILETINFEEVKTIYEDYKKNLEDLDDAQIITKNFE